VSPLEGGRVVKSVAFSIGSKIGLATMVTAMVAAAVAAFTAHLVILVIILPLSILEFILERRAYMKKHEGVINVTVEKEQATEEPAAEMKLNVEAIMPKMPRMPPLQNCLAFAGYAVLALALFGLMFVMGHEPGADVAMAILKG
jgi:hypothetical protein